MPQDDNERLAEAYAQGLRGVVRRLVESAAIILGMAPEQPPSGARGMTDERVEMQLAYRGAGLEERALP